MNHSGNIEPKFSKYRKNSGFTLPENYFDELPGKIQDIITREKKHEEVFKYKLHLKPKFAYLIASVFIIGILFGSYFYFSPASNNSLNSEDIIEYMIYSENEHDILDELPDNEYQEALSEEQDEIIEYLATDYIDYSLILAEY